MRGGNGGTATTPGILEAAGALLAQGFRPVILYPAGITRGDKLTGGKEPFGKEWGVKPLSLDVLESDVRHFESKGFTPGVGLCLGPGRAPGGLWLADVEGDGPQAEASRTSLFGGELVVTRGWGSVRGEHRLLRCDPDRMTAIVERLARFQVKGSNQPGVFHLPTLPDLELRFGGLKPDGVVKQLQSACPPTPGTDGTPREWNDVEEVADAPESFYATLEALAAPAEEPPPRAARARRNGSTFEATSWDPERRAIAYLDRCEPAISGSKGHNQAFKAACKIGPGFDLDPDVAFRLLRDHYNPRCVPEWSEAELRHKVDDAYANEPKRGWLLNADRNGKAQGSAGSNGRGGSTSPPAGEGGAEESPRAEIEITTERHHVVNQTVESLARDPDLYSRHESLVTVVIEDAATVKLTASTSLSNVAGSPKIIALSEPNVGCVLTKNATFYQWRPTRNGDDVAVDVHPPDWLIRSVASRRHWSGVRQLLMVAECPYPRPDGSIVETPGYDHATGALYHPSGTFPPVPARPTRDDAEAAWGRIRVPIRQFPFGSDNDRAVWLAGLLSAIARPSIAGPVPGFAVIGNKAGAGKGLLVDLVGILAHGRPLPTSSYPVEAEEAKKVTLAIGIAGKPIVHFDNLEEGSHYGNAGLDSAVTSGVTDGRVLGASRMAGETPLRVVWFLSGNNITPAKDAYRRWLPCNLLTDLESPEERRDIEIRDLRSYVSDRRGELVRDALTILRAHALAGRPTGDWAPLGSFEVWDPIIRGAVWFASGLDCCETRRKTAEESPARQAQVALLEGWRELPEGSDRGRGITASDAVGLVGEHPKQYPTLHNALEHYGRDNKLANARQIGNRIRGMRGNVLDGMKFVDAGSEHRMIRWKVVKASPETPSGDLKGESVGSSESDSNPTREKTHSDNYVKECNKTRKGYENGPETDSLDTQTHCPDPDEEVTWTS